MKIFITGIQGFIAGRLSLFLRNEGCTVSGSTSKMVDPNNGRSLGGKIYHYKLGDPFDEAMFAGMDVVIHCAHDFQKGALRKNITGTIALAEAAVKHQVKTQIFISSLSSRPDAQSEYGISKYETEQVFEENNGIVVRPGTVLGPGGIFAGMARIVKRFPIVPLLDGGSSQMYIIDIDDLCRAIYRIMNAKNHITEYNLYYPERVTLKEILTALRSLLKRKTIFIPVPSKLLILPLAFLNTIGIKLPVDIDNLRGFMKSQVMPYPSDLQKVLSSYRSIEDILKAHFNG